MNTLALDLRHSLRLLRQNPGFASLVLLALALGIGANTAIFTVVNAALLRSLPYADPGRLVVALHDGSYPVAPANYLDWRAASRSFEDMAAAQAWGPSLTASDRSERVSGLQVTANMFRLLGVRPERGRLFEPNEDQPGAEPAVIVSHRFWQERLSSDPAAIGRKLLFDGAPYTVIGVMPPDFQFAPFWITDAGIWSPLPLNARQQDRRGQSLRVFARLKPGVSLQQAQAELDVINRGLEARYPDSNAHLTAQVVPLREKVVGNIRPMLVTLMAAVGFVLLIACSNVANLILSRVSARRRELAVRTALGASRLRLIRQLLTESALLALLGGACGAILAYLGLHVLSASLPPGKLPRQQELSVDTAALLFTLALSLLSGLVAGVAPGWRSTRLDPQEALKEGGRGSAGVSGRRIGPRLLVGAQTAFAVALLIGAGLMLRSMSALVAVNPGFDPEHLLTMSVSTAGTKEAAPGNRLGFFEEAATRLAHIPGVAAVGTINHLPIGGDTWGLSITLQDLPTLPSGQTPSATYRVVQPGYFQAMRIALREGRDFAASDQANSPGVVIVNEALAKRYWPGQSALGRRISLSGPTDAPTWLTIAGVVANVRQGEWTEEPGNEVYLPLKQSARYLSDPAPHYAYLTYVIRTSGDPSQVASAARAVVWGIDRAISVSQVQTMQTVISEALWRERVSARLLGIFAAVAFLLAVTGIYAVVSQNVAQRSQEIAVRMALGARPASVILWAFRHGMMPVAAGMLVGCAVAWGGSRYLASLLYHVKPYDPLTFLGVALLLILAALSANYVPARRAARLNPSDALR